MSTYLITGTSRGIGLALSSLLAALPASSVHTVFATSRNDPTDALKSVIANSSGRVKHVKLDVTSLESAKAAAAEVERLLDGKGLDVLVNNAGVMPFGKGVEAMDDLESTFRTNVSSAHYVTSAFLPLLRKGTEKKIVNLSTTLGSLELTPKFAPFPVPAYKISKAALNMLTVQYALALKEEGFTVVSLCPGWIQTDLGGEHADLTVETGAKATLESILEFTQADNGKFCGIKVEGWEKQKWFNRYDGASPPW